MSSNQQEYKDKPTNYDEVQGLSSKTIYNFMTTGRYYEDSYYPSDVDDWERCRALLLCYPEWKSRLLEMGEISQYWKILVKNWNEIETKYDADILKYGDNAYGKGECDAYIRSLLKIVKQLVC